jgi:hypothetical protein
MMRTNFAPQARASRKSRSKRSSACATVGRPASKLDRMTRSRVFGKFSTDCEASQNRQVNACAGIGFPQTSQSLVKGTVIYGVSLRTECNAMLPNFLKVFRLFILKMLNV